MARVLMCLAMLLLAVTVANAVPASHAASGASNSDRIVRGPTYRYILREDHGGPVCGHMLRVFNVKFTRLWDSHPLPSSKSGGRDYSAPSKYAFSLLPGAVHNTKATFVMRFSAQPTSSEFSAIDWREGRAILGGCPNCPWDHVSLPIIVAHFDFDNDGTIDTVIKQQFFGGYPHAGDSLEYLTVWRGQNLTIRDTADMTILDHPKDRTLTPIIASGTYLRPFIYRGQAYVARYVQNIRQAGNLDSEPTAVPWTQAPQSEDMLVEQYSYSGQKEKITGRPTWDVHRICDFTMKQLDER